MQGGERERGEPAEGSAGGGGGRKGRDGEEERKGEMNVPLQVLA